MFDEGLDILVLMGGPSREREVSRVSGEAVAEGLAACGHRVRRADISPIDTGALDGDRPDVVFIALHGAFGEDGQVQRLCEARGLAYVGSGPHASELAMDKAAAKALYRKAGLLTPDWAVIADYDAADRRAEAVAAVGMPCVTKPIDGGSSMDVAIPADAAARDAALAELLDTYTRALIERFVGGRELTVGILGETPLPVIEIRPRRGFYDYQAKYADDATAYVFDHGLDAAAVASLQAAALTAHRVLGCRDMSRSDFLLDEAGRAWLLETNTIPGFTGHSLLPKAAAEVGISFPALCEELVSMALGRKGVADSSRLPDTKRGRQPLYHG